MPDDTELTRILRYVSGECSPDEAVDTERWIAGDPERTRAAATLRHLWSRGGVRSDEGPAEGVAWDVDAAWRRVAGEHVRSRPVRTLELMAGDARAARWRRLRVLLPVAAVLALAVASLPRWRSSSVPGAVRPGSDSLAVREFATAPAQRAEIRLSDGTRVVLAPASRLYMPVRYGIDTRALRLEGEAYFDVRHDPARPFRVRTARGFTEDVGTRFAVRAYAGDSTERVAVAEGAVLLRAAAADAPAAMLTAGTLGILPPSGVPAVRAVPDIDRYLAWTEGRLVFRDAPLGEVAVQLERWYALDIRFAEPALRRLLFTGAFRDESVSEVLRTLEVAFDLTARRAGDTVTLAP